MSIKSPTMDEQGFLVRGLGYVRSENTHMRVGHPLGLNALNALLLRNDDSVALPTTDPSWQLPSFHRPAELFLWEIGNDVDYVMFLARLPTVFLTLLLAAIVHRWTAEATRSRALALLALGFIALDPNILAHGRLTTTDLGITAAAALSGYTLWRYLIDSTPRNAILAGIGFGLLNNTKFTAGLFVPLFALVILLCWLLDWREKRSAEAIKQHLPFIFLFPLTALLTLWACYGFDIGTLPANLPALPQLSGRTLPLAHHLEQLLDIGNRSTKGAPAFLLGDYSNDGWWYYFPVAFALKTPLATLALILCSAALLMRERIKQSFSVPTEGLALRAKPSVGTLKNKGAASLRSTTQTKTVLALLIPSTGYMAIAMTTTVNLGYRHVLPILPFLIVFGLFGFAKARHVALPTLLLALVAFGTLRVAPDYLSYFNLAAGGPDNGWRQLVDSNIDWGQDLKLLGEWVEDNEVDTIWLSYFGEGRPTYYNIPYRGLSSFPPRLMSPNADPFYSHNPAPGIYAISATNLQGPLFQDHDTFAFFRDREPFVKIGRSIFLYEVASTGRSVSLWMESWQLSDIPPDDFAQLNTNDVRPIWFNADEGRVYPHDGLTNIVAFEDNFSFLASPRAFQITDERTPMGPWELAELTYIDTRNNRYHVNTYWFVKEHSNAALQVFVHALDADGNIIAQADRMTAVTTSLEPNDIVIQTLELPNDIAPVTLRVGLYDWQTGERFGEPLTVDVASLSILD